MKSSLVLSTKGFVLYPFILIFLSSLIMINGISINLLHRTQELKNAIKLDQFSLVEIQSIRLIKQQFLTFNPKNFETKIGEWSIKVTFNDETVIIVYQGLQTIYATLDYDTVFKNVLDYQIIETEKGNSD